MIFQKLPNDFFWVALVDSSDVLGQYSPGLHPYLLDLCVCGNGIYP